MTQHRLAKLMEVVSAAVARFKYGKKNKVPVPAPIITYVDTMPEVRKHTYDGDILPHIVIHIPGVVKGRVYGGPYRHIPAGLCGVKMAEEIQAGCDVDVPTKDFNVPQVDRFKIGLVHAILLLRKHGEIYVGCMGGVGRTGLFMSALAKIMEMHQPLPSSGDGNIASYVQYVRDHYNHHAVETSKQMQYLRNLYLDDIISLIKVL